jgi:hypothetical protein
LALSLGGHALLVLGLLWTPSQDEDARSMAVETCVFQCQQPALSLAPPLLNPVLLSLPVQHRDEEVRQVSLIEPQTVSPGRPVGSNGPPGEVGPPGAEDGRPGNSGHGGLGKGPGLLAVGAEAQSVVFVLDCSLSMGLHGALARAKAELLTSLRHLPAHARFQIIAYNRQADPLYLNSRGELLPAEPQVLRQAGQSILALSPSGSTDHVRALLRGLVLRPEMLFFLTDANDLGRQAVEDVTRYNRGQTRIHVVELSAAPGNGERSPLWDLAARNGGTYRRVAPE